MSLRDLVQHELNQPGILPRYIEVREGGLSLECDLVALDTLALAFERLSIAVPALAQAPLAELRRVSESLAARLTYLLEPIRPIESDAEQCSVQMRSLPPEQSGDGTSYYELLVRRGGGLVLCRFRKVPGQPREVIAAQVTRQVFLRLVADLEQAS